MHITRRIAQNFGLRFYKPSFEITGEIHSVSVDLMPPSLFRDDSIKMQNSASLMFSVTDSATTYTKGRKASYFSLSTPEVLDLAYYDPSKTPFEHLSKKKVIIVGEKEGETDKVELILYVCFEICRTVN